jgi:hypothetical protein
MTKRIEHGQEPQAKEKPKRIPLTLAQELGLREEMLVLILWEPPGFMESLNLRYEPGSYDAELTMPKYDYIHSFITSRFLLENMLPLLIHRLAQDGVLWISWPAANSEANQSELTTRIVRELCQANGFIEVKTLRVGDEWKGIKFVPDWGKLVHYEVEKKEVLRFGLEDGYVPGKYRKTFD